MRLFAAGTALALLALGLGGPAMAADQTQSLAVPGSALVRGGAPLPEYHLNFLPGDSGGPLLQLPGMNDNLEIALSSPGTGVFHFLFSPLRRKSGERLSSRRSDRLCWLPS